MGFFDVFTTKNADAAAGRQTAALEEAYRQASGLLGQGREALTSNYTAGLQPFLTNYEGASQGTQTLADALGLNGPEGNARATTAFQNNPGYQFQLKQGNENILRNAARTTGTAGVGSGNTNIDLLNYGQGVANQGWNQYIQNLLPYLGQSTANAGGIGSLYSGLGNQLNQSFGTQANAAYGTQAGIGNAKANAALAGNAASANLIDAIMSGSNLAASLLPFLPSSPSINYGTIGGTNPFPGGSGSAIY